MCLDWGAQFSLASTVYFALSKLFPAQETVLDRAIIEPGDESPLFSLNKAEGQSEAAKIV
jgi:hypothetical protein